MTHPYLKKTTIKKAVKKRNSSILKLLYTLMLRNVVDSSGIICFPKTVGETPAFVQIQIQIYKQENVTIVM